MIQKMGGTRNLRVRCWSMDDRTSSNLQRAIRSYQPPLMALHITTGCENQRKVLALQIIEILVYTCRRQFIHIISPAYLPIRLKECTDHVIHHALITWISCTDHVADHTLFTCLTMH